MLELIDVSFNVDSDLGKKEILKNVSLKIDEKFVVVTGPNGSGKSTLAKIIMGIEKPTSGRILFYGKDITNMSITERAQEGIGFAFQQPVKFKGIRVKDIISLAVGREVSLEEACEYLSKVGLCAEEYVDRELNNSLSGGELKRIEIAMIMARRTSLSILDEPEAGIDLWSFNKLIDIFEDMSQDNKGSILIISHQERILNIADKIIVLDDGRIDRIGDKEEVLPSLLDIANNCKYYKGER